MADDRRAPTLRIDPLESRDLPNSVWLTDGFDRGPANGTIPAGWTQWSSGALSSLPFSVTGAAAWSGPSGIASPQAVDARAWLPTEIPADYSAAVAVRIDGSSGAGVFVRGVALDSKSPSYLAATVRPGGGIEFAEVGSGKQLRFASVLPIQPAPKNVWFRVSLEPAGQSVVVRVQRLDSGEYLTPTGEWKGAPVDAIRTTVENKLTSGQVGVTRDGRGTGAVALDEFSVLASGSLTESFDSGTNPNLPGGWQSWASLTGSSVGFTLDSNRLISNGPSNLQNRAWTAVETIPADARLTGAILADSLIPGGVLLRGSDLDTSNPTFYGAVLTRGLTIQLVKVVDGVETILGSIKSSNYTSGQWVKLSLSAEGDLLRVIAFRTDTNKWLSSSGEWLDSPDAALEVRDGTIRGVGMGGFFRKPGAAGTLRFDDFTANAVAGSGIPPQITVTPGTPVVGGDVTFLATADDPSAIRRVEFRLAGKTVYTANSLPAQWTLDSTTLTNGSHTLSVRTVDDVGAVGESSVTFQVGNGSTTPRPSLPLIPRKYPHIRIAQLAYSGNPMGAFELGLLQSSVDLVIPNEKYLAAIDAASPSTPQLIYSNVSNLYQNLLADWLSYADSNRSTRESAFYHVTAATAFQGNSPSSIPVTYFWGVSRTAPGVAAVDLTSAARGGRLYGVEFGGVGSAVHIGYLEKFREINISFKRAAVTTGWGGVWEYATAVDTGGIATAWKTLTILSDGTIGLRRDGRITFDPPSDWVAGVAPGTAGRNFYVRFRSTTGTAAQGPEAKLILGRDYVGANGGTTGIIPAFDAAADRNGDGYLTDTEYSTRTTGKDARFVYETRLFYPYYGQMRYVTNPSAPVVQRWAADFHKRLLAANPLADGVMLDNSLGKVPFDGISLAESTATYGADLGRLIETTWKGIAPKFVLANTAGGQAAADPVAANSPAVMEEFLLRPTVATWSTVNDITELVRRRLSAADPSPYLVLDSHPGNSSPTDPRTQIGALAYYYLVADPEKTFLMFFGGSAPATTWREHWTPAAAVNVGLPLAAMTTFATGADPQNASLTYKVFGRTYGNALVLYKPRSYAPGVGTGTLDDATATVHSLNGNYRTVNADGTVGPVVNRITLRNGEGAVLIKA